MDFLASYYFAWRLQIFFTCMIVVKNLVYKSRQQARENELRHVIRFYPQPLYFTGHDVAVVVDIVTLKTKASICSNAGI